VKKIPIERTWAEFWKVWFIPPPAPRSPGGRLFITAARLGDANIPIEIPLSASTRANSGSGKSMGSKLRRTKLSAAPSIPPVAKARAPKRSETRKTIRNVAPARPVSQVQFESAIHL